MEEKIDLEKEFKKINEKSSLKDIQDYMKKMIISRSRAALWKARQ